MFLLPIVWDKKVRDTWPGAGYERFSCNENFSTERESDKKSQEIRGPTSNKQRQEEEPTVTISLKGTEQLGEFLFRSRPFTRFSGVVAKVEGSGITL